jgi:hypothetical protein
MKKAIEFFCWETDEPIAVQLEPEAHVFTVQPGMSLQFEPVNAADDFQWTLRICHREKAVQLIPETNGSYDGINIYRNGKLVKEWTDLYS